MAKRLRRRENVNCVTKFPREKRVFSDQLAEILVRAFLAAVSAALKGDRTIAVKIFPLKKEKKLDSGRVA